MNKKRGYMMTTDSDTETLVYSLWEAGKKLGLTRNGSYEAAKRGDIPTIKIGRLIKVPKAAFHAKFGRAE
jgi:excisionase family DNA binding protein